ncbi:YwmB family TATA-box binding protein [Peribacillus kribbensis]|uniref:YwmB family TATA-box binding protein n=1 Tax=Peribacillus kribbensis TaxID=356658 RepID=UPI0003F71213|nr:YwmB family TATA-box binding protein [Peribacillus kribbensis]
MTKKYIHIFIYTLLIGFISLMIGKTTIIAKNDSDLARMVEVLKHEKEMKIKEWSVFARESDLSIDSKSKFYKKTAELKAKYPDFSWSFDPEERALTAAGVKNNRESGLKETIKVMMPLSKKDPVSYMLYEVKGEKWSGQYSGYLSKDFQLRINDIFRGNPSIFTCIKGEINGNIDEVLSFYVKKMITAFNADEIESIKEKDFLSISAHTKLFSQTLPNEDMNLQLATRREGLGGKTTFVVGTPIITFEY